MKQEKFSFMLQNSRGGLDFSDNSLNLLRKEYREDSSFKAVNQIFEESRSNFQIFNIDKTINFAEMTYRHQPKQEIQERDSSEQERENLGCKKQKQGLKNLSKILLDLLKSKSEPFSLCDLQKELQKQLCPSLPKTKMIFPLNSKNSNEEKNIKRRCYDAINVLIACGILQKQQNNFSYNHRRNKRLALPTHSPLQALQKQLLAKRQSVSMLRKKLEIQYLKQKYLREWTERQQKSIESTSQLKFYFPLIFVYKEQFEANERIDLFFNNTYSLEIRGKDLITFGDIDILEDLLAFDRINTQPNAIVQETELDSNKSKPETSKQHDHSGIKEFLSIQVEQLGNVSSEPKMAE